MAIAAEVDLDRIIERLLEGLVHLCLLSVCGDWERRPRGTI